MYVIFVGISNRSNSLGELAPLDSSTPTGKIINSIEARLNRECLKTNLVNFTPLGDNGKIRYPNKEEIEVGLIECLEFLRTHSPCLVFLLGKIVEKEILESLNTEKIKENIYRFGGSIILASVYHPSYIHTYKKQLTDQYIDEIVEIVRSYC
jgi:uracil-DNA glycosylase family 4